MAETVLINGTAYGWADITVNILGTPVAGIDGIKYSDNQEIEDNYGAGKLPVSRGYGQIKTEGSITLHAEEVIALQKAAPGKRLQAIPPFDIVVSYLPEGGTVTTDTLKNCQFKKNSREAKKGDKSFSVELDLIISHIEWDA
jgi:hypothetical protein